METVRCFPDVCWPLYSNVRRNVSRERNGCIRSGMNKLETNCTQTSSLKPACWWTLTAWLKKGLFENAAYQMTGEDGYLNSCTVFPARPPGIKKKKILGELRFSMEETYAAPWSGRSLPYLILFSVCCLVTILRGDTFIRVLFFHQGQNHYQGPWWNVDAYVWS